MGAQQQAVDGADATAPWTMAVVVPARDEADLLPRCVAAVVAAADRVRACVRVHVVVVADACVDHTERAAALALADCDASIVRSATGSVGYARRVGVAAARRVCATDRGRLWIAMTDADSVVPANWLQYQLRAAVLGWDAVAGAIAVADWLGRPPRTALALADHRRWQRRVGVQPVHGANLGARADALEAIGGIPDVGWSEDAGTIALLERSGRWVLHTSALVVDTSARRSWRAPGGFSSLLDGLGGDRRSAAARPASAVTAVGARRTR